MVMEKTSGEATGIWVGRVDRIEPEALAGADFSFEVTEEARPPFDGPGLPSIKPIIGFRKEYGIDYDLLSGADADNLMIAAAQLNARVVAYVAVSRSWNNCALVEELAVDRAYRRAGVARQLMNAVVEWAREVNLPAIRLETQSTNVAACRFYERYGFEMGGTIDIFIPHCLRRTEMKPHCFGIYE